MRDLYFLIALLAFGFAAQSRADNAPLFQGCGTYLVRGQLDKKVPGQLNVFNGSISETKLKLINITSEDLETYKGATVEITARFIKVVRNYHGQAEVKRLGFRVPDPLASHGGEGFWLNQKAPCH